MVQCSQHVNKKLQMNGHILEEEYDIHDDILNTCDENMDGRQLFIGNILTCDKLVQLKRECLRINLRIRGGKNSKELFKIKVL